MTDYVNNLTPLQKQFAKFQEEANLALSKQNIGRQTNSPFPSEQSDKHDIKKETRKRRIYVGLSLVVTILFIILAVYLFSRDKDYGNYMDYWGGSVSCICAIFFGASSFVELFSK